MNLIARLISTRQLRSILLGTPFIVTGIYIFNLILGVQFSVRMNSSPEHTQFFNVSISGAEDGTVLLGSSQVSDILEVTTIMLARTLPLIIVITTLTTFTTSIRAWLGAGVNRRTIFAICQVFIGFFSLFATTLTAALMGGFSVTGLASFTSFSLETVLYTFLLYVVLLELTLLGTAVCLRFPLWIALTLIFGVPFAFALFIGNVASGVLHISLDLDLTNSVPLRTAVSLGISLIMASLSWFTLFRLPMRRG
ncbi:hypothetical protein JTE88_02050 [Arcanobacterium phocisimile]|uniref:ABC-2 family transporter protein n=1 Tax=Arcanobacterium phocisimile TaxID=1302235 RepID=A0ABX7II85_9ACTO|nr:hypothetical protein [Arcanobacterium phocisimile]QRV02560.1 hypothetical protein JTE88_02050 [Arcanobacterium phocisimile]